MNSISNIISGIRNNMLLFIIIINWDYYIYTEFYTDYINYKFLASLLKHMFTDFPSKFVHMLIIIFFLEILFNIVYF